MYRSKEPANQYQVDEAEHGQQMGVVLRQAAVARLVVLELALNEMEAAPDFRTHAGLGILQLFLRTPQQILLERFAHARAHRKVPVDDFVHVCRALPTP